MAWPHVPNGVAGQIPHAPGLITGGGGGGLTLAELLEVLAGTKEPKSIKKAALSEEVNELLGKGGPPSGPAGGDLTGTYPEPTIGGEKVTTGKIKLLAIVTALLGEESVTTLKIAGVAVTTAKIALEAVTTAILANEAVSTAKLKLLAVTAAILAEECVTTAKIANENVTAGKLAAAVTAKLLEVQTASGLTLREVGAGGKFAPDATRPAMVGYILTVKAETTNVKVQVAGNVVAEWKEKGALGSKVTLGPFPVAAGANIEVLVSEGTLSSAFSYTILLHA